MSNSVDLEELTPEVLPSHKPVEDAVQSSRSTNSADASSPRSSMVRGPLMRYLALGALVVVPAVVAYGAAAAQDPVYEARAELVYEGSTNATADERVLATQVALLESRAFLEQAGVVQAGEIADLQDAVAVELVGGSNVIRMAVQDADPARARGLVTSLADAHLEGIVGPDVRVEQRELLETRLLDASQNLAHVLDQIAARGGSIDPAVQGQLERLRAERMAYEGQVSDLQRRLLDLQLDEMEGATAPAALLGAPYVLEDPVAPQPVRSAAAGALAGTILAATLMVLRARRRQGE